MVINKEQSEKGESLSGRLFEQLVSSDAIFHVINSQSSDRLVNKLQTSDGGAQLPSTSL